MVAGRSAGTTPTATAAADAARTAAAEARALAASPLPARLQTMGRSTAGHTGFPLGVLFLLALFLLVQDRIDRRDPKLALAPVYPDPDVAFPVTPRSPDDPTESDR